MVTLRCAHSHLFPGAALGVDSGSPAPSGACEVMILFGDGSRAEAGLLLTDGSGRLEVEPYATAAGTRIDAKHWAVADAPGNSLAITRRLPGDAGGAARRARRDGAEPR